MKYSKIIVEFGRDQNSRTCLVSTLGRFYRVWTVTCQPWKRAIVEIAYDKKFCEIVQYGLVSIASKGLFKYRPQNKEANVS